MKTLIIDTSGTYTTIALVHDDELIAYQTLLAQPLVNLHELIRQLTHNAGWELSVLDRIAVVTGPGSWTGLNIGVTAAKTLAQVLDIALVELSTLDILAAAQPWTENGLCALIDAKRDNVYHAFYRVAAGRPDLAASQPALVPFSDLLGALETGVLVVEYGNVFCERVATERTDITVISYDSLPNRGLLLALQTAEGEGLRGDEILGVMPVYMQKLVR